MSKEAIKLALEEMKIGNYNSAAERLEAALAKQEHDLQDTRCECCGYMTYQREHMGCIRSAKQEQGQPVAIFTGEYWIDDAHDRMLAEVVCYMPPNSGTPLYFHTQPKQEHGEPSCCNGNCPNTKDCEQAMQCLYTTPQQRTWVGLTPVEVHDIWAYNHTPQEICDAVEAKLKEKNVL